MVKNVLLSEQLRRAILNASETRYRISKETGISESILSRFIRGDSGLSMAYIDILCSHLGLRLIGPETTTKKTKRKGG